MSLDRSLRLIGYPESYIRDRGARVPRPTFDCPRRIERTMALWSPDWNNQKHSNYIDFALDPEGHPVLDDDGNAIPPQDHWRRDGTCSYCGSMSPERLFEAIDAGAELGPTDKNYKVYVDGGAERNYPLGDCGKFYTVHLNRENAQRLRELIMAGKVKVGYPGHFYNGLWLATPREVASA